MKFKLVSFSIASLAFKLCPDRLQSEINWLHFGMTSGPGNELLNEVLIA